MDISSGIMGVMFVISNSLLYPVVILLLILVALSIIMIGQFTSEYASRSRDFKKLKSGLRPIKESIELKNFKEAENLLKNTGSNFLLKEFINDLGNSLEDKCFFIEAEKLLQDYEVKIAKELEVPRLVSKIGPMIGLMGTLIPMGPGLLGLTTGDIQTLASNLAIAFATTVLGILAGGISYSILMVKKRWYTQDLSDMEYIVEVLK